MSSPYRLLPGLTLATIFTLGGLTSLSPFSSPSRALHMFGFHPSITSSPGAQTVIKLEGSRITTIGLALLGMAWGGCYEGMDVLMACVGWMGLVDGYVLRNEGGREGKWVGRVVYQGVFAVWGLLGMTSGKGSF